MEDDFYEPLGGPGGNSSGFFSKILSSIITSPFASSITLILAILLTILCTRHLSGRSSQKVPGKDGMTVWMPPYWVPFIGHGLQFMWDPVELMISLRDQSLHGIFALYIGSKTVNVVSDPSLVKSVMQQRESAVEFHTIAWNVVTKFFGVPTKSKPKYDAALEKFTFLDGYLMKEPHIGNMLKSTIDTLQENIPQMISFMDSEIDQQPWERYAKASYISETEVEINLMAMMRDMMGNASTSAVFGHGLLSKYPDILHDVYDMDAGMMYFVMGLPAWTPWPSVNRAHQARQRVWRAIDDFHKALDANSEDKPYESAWGDFEDVSEFIMRRHELFKEYGISVKERVDIAILWALNVNANLLVYWLILHILNTPGLAERIRSEIAPFAQVAKPVTIGSFSEAPKLTLSHEGLAKNCPLLKASYYEALRICNQPWSIRNVVGENVTISSKQGPDAPSFVLGKGEYITMPHDLYMRDPKYFKSPETFDPERFLAPDENGALTANIGTIRPYGGGPSMCKGRVLAEHECLALVAGVLMFWDIQPVNRTGGYVIPKQKRTSAVSLPVSDTRVRIQRRRFEWDN